MYYHFKCIKKDLFYFLLGLILGLLCYKIDFTKVLMEDVHAVSPSTWYYAREMRLYPSLIMQGNTSLQNGNNTFVVDSYNNVIPYIQFDRITTSGTRLVFNSPVVEGEHSIHLDIYSCQAPSFKNTFKTGDSSSTSALYEVDYIRHTTLALANAQIAGTGSSTLKNCRQDSYILNINSNGSGKYSSIDLNYDSSYSQWYILGYDYQFDGLSTKYLYGLRTDIINSTNSSINSATDRIINNANSNTYLNRTQILSNANSNRQEITNNNTSNTQQQISNANSNTQEMISNNNSNFNQVNSNLTDDSLDANTGNDFFDDDNFNGQDDLLSLVTLPIELAEEFTTNSCQPIILPFTIHNTTTNISLPCMSTVYTNYFSSIYNIITTIMTGLIAYGCIMSMIKTTVKVLDPTNASLEVTDL